MPQEFDLETFYNSAKVEVIHPRSNYAFYTKPHRTEFAPEFRVVQDNTIPIPDLHDSKLAPNDYRFLHTYNIAVTLAAIASENFPGAQASGVAYPFEYSSLRGSNQLNTELIQLIKNIWKSENVPLVEIGGQEGQWSGILQREAQIHGLHIHATIIDLDLQRRFPDRFPSHTYETRKNQITYIQADAHQLKTFYQEGVIKQPKVISLMNVSDVIYDPFSIFEQAWNLLPQNGLLLIGSSFHSAALPFSVLNNGKPYLEYQETNATSRDVQKYIVALHQQTARLHSLIGTGVFSFDSSRQENDKAIATISQALYDCKDAPIYNLSGILRIMGYKNETVFGAHASACAVIKDEGMPNPFEKFSVVGISRRYFHVNEYPFPQIHRVVDIAHT